jgi:hypothetical protein
LIGDGETARKRRSYGSIAFLLCGSLVLNGCKGKVDNGYHVVSYDGVRKEWTVIDKKFDRDAKTYHRIRFVLACDSYEHNEGGFEHGPDACVLHVGDLFKTEMKGGPGHYVFVDPENKKFGTGETEFYVARNEGETREVQFFKIVKEEALPDEK